MWSGKKARQKKVTEKRKCGGGERLLLPPTPNNNGVAKWCSLDYSNYFQTQTI